MTGLCISQCQLGLLFLPLFIGSIETFSFFDSPSSHESFSVASFSNGSSLDDGSSDAYETLRSKTTGSGSVGNADPSSLMVNRRTWNTSVALTIPMFSFKLPHLNGGFIANQALYGLFAFGISALTFVVSFIFTGNPADESRKFARLGERAKTSQFNFMGPDLTRSFGMDGLQCMQKVVCQANRLSESRKYGVISKTIQGMFPAPPNSTIELDSSPFLSAARDGRYSKESCENLYDCLLDALGSARYLAHWYGGNGETGTAKFLMRMIDSSS